MCVFCCACAEELGRRLELCEERRCYGRFSKANSFKIFIIMILEVMHIYWCEFVKELRKTIRSHINLHSYNYRCVTMLHISFYLLFSFSIITFPMLLNVPQRRIV
jgi:hypothetical protein